MRGTMWRHSAPPKSVGIGETCEILRYCAAHHVGNPAAFICAASNLERLFDALLPLANMADVNMNDPISKWLTVAQIKEAERAIVAAAGQAICDSDGTATAALCEDIAVPKDCQARASNEASPKGGRNVP